jgi:hypothetical protein
MIQESYLGDGLYGHMEGPTLWLRAPRASGDHFVALEPDVLEAALRLVNKERPKMLETIVRGVCTMGATP